jgi:hypothetical protein
MAKMDIPNETPGGSRENSSGPMGRAGSSVDGPNQTKSGDRRNGTMPLGGSRGVIQPPNDMTRAPIGHSSMR